MLFFASSPGRKEGGRFSASSVYSHAERSQNLLSTSFRPKSVLSIEHFNNFYGITIGGINYNSLILVMSKSGAKVKKGMLELHPCVAAADVENLVTLPDEQNPMVIGAARLISDLKQVLREKEIIPICRIYDALTMLLDKVDLCFGELIHPMKTYVAKRILESEEIDTLLEKAKNCLKQFRDKIKAGDLVDIFEVRTGAFYQARVDKRTGDSIVVKYFGFGQGAQSMATIDSVYDSVDYKTNPRDSSMPTINKARMDHEQFDKTEYLRVRDLRGSIVYSMFMFRAIAL